MKVRPVNLDNADEVAALDRWVCTHPQSTPFHRPAWVIATARGTGQEALMLVAEQDGAITGVLPLMLVHSPIFGRSLVSSGFAVDGGILASDPEAVELLADACWREALVRSCSSAELRGGVLPSSDWTIGNDAYLGFSRQLEADEEAQLPAIPKRHRAEIRKGLANGLTIERGRSQRLLAIHYRLYAENVHRLGTPVFPRTLFSEVLAAFGEDSEISVVFKGGAAHSAALTLYHNGVCMPYWHGATEEARALRSNEVCYFDLMNHARSRGCTHFDFGRSKVGTGPAAWKSTWGWDGKPLSYATRAIPGMDARDINPLSPRNRLKVEIWKRLPLPLANRLGPWLSRGLG